MSKMTSKAPITAAEAEYEATWQAARAAYEGWIEPVRDLEPSWENLPEDHADRLFESQKAALKAYRASLPPPPSEDEVERAYRAGFGDGEAWGEDDNYLRAGRTREGEIAKGIAALSKDAAPSTEPDERDQITALTAERAKADDAINYWMDACKTADRLGEEALDRAEQAEAEATRLRSQLEMQRQQALVSLIALVDSNGGELRANSHAMANAPGRVLNRHYDPASDEDVFWTSKLEETT